MKIKAIIIFFAGVFLGWFAFHQFEGKTISNQPVGQQKEETTPLGSLITLKTPKEDYEIVVYRNQIMFEPFEDLKDVYKPFMITKDEYPDLFKQGVADLSFIKAEITEKDGKMLIKLSNNQPDHGVYSETSSILIDPVSGEVKK